LCFTRACAANEVAEKLAVVGFQTNMLTYLTQQMHLPLAKAATTLTNFGGASAATPLIGAFLADACIGRFWTIAGASVVYQVVSVRSLPPFLLQAMHIQTEM
jgi:solute carrier family 15 (peptide/histidine transporter), member 3/4